MATIVHFEIPADDIERAKTFYTDLFGWEIEKAEGGMEYWMIKTTGEKPVEGGMMMRQQPQQPITNYIDVPSVSEFAGKVEGLNGKILVPKTPVPGVGYFAVCMDTENNVFGIWETDPEASVFRDEAEVIVAILSAVIASDEKYSVDEMRSIWYEIEQMEVFNGRDFKKMEADVLKSFNKKSSEPAPFTDSELDLIMASAHKMLNAKQKEQAFTAAVKLAYADKTLEGYPLDIDEREQMLLDRLQHGLGIPADKMKKIVEGVKPKY